MDSLRNVPIYLSYEDDGTVGALCPLLPDYHCKAASRSKALRAMQQLIQNAFATSTPAEAVKGQEYEVVYLAVVASTDSVNHFINRYPRRPKNESPLIEIR
ncbi:MAG TPA: hypothetical protein VNO21_03245 [Polyangiaceae bacterium]|nr:hypothetical protein [Polyangiaceae bacterium]